MSLRGLVKPKEQDLRHDNSEKSGRAPARDVAVRHIGVEFPAEIADRILAPVDDGRVKTITDRMIALVQLALENEPAIPAQARQEELPMTG